MIGMMSALIGLAAYFFAVFVFGLAWRKREVSQRIRGRIKPADPLAAERKDYAHLA